MKTTKQHALEQVKQAFGFVPNLMTTIADGSPAVVSAYLAASDALGGGVLTPSERQVVMLAVSAFNDCHYCTAAHRTAAKSMGVSQFDVEAIDGLQLPEQERSVRGLARAG